MYRRLGWGLGILSATTILLSACHDDRPGRHHPPRHEHGDRDGHRDRDDHRPPRHHN